MIVARRHPLFRTWTALAVALSALPAAGCSLQDPAAGARGGGAPVEGRVVSVTDGDTLRVRFDQGERSVAVRLIGIDAAETRRPGTPVQCGGPEATAHLQRLVAAGDRVSVRGDRSQDREDRYGRLLAYVTPRSGRQLNRSQVEAGWARVYVYDDRPFGQLEAFRRAEQDARRADRGVWGQCGGDFHRPAG